MHEFIKKLIYAKQSKTVQDETFRYEIAIETSDPKLST